MLSKSYAIPIYSAYRSNDSELKAHNCWDMGCAVRVIVLVVCMVWDAVCKRSKLDLIVAHPSGILLSRSPEKKAVEA